MTFELSGNIVDVVTGRIFPGTVKVESGRIAGITSHPVDEPGFILPGLIDAHIHIESSMLIPSEFARLAAVHGTTGTVSDPHEIANVLGTEGVKFMIANGKKVPFKFAFGAPSCVPATSFETSGAKLGPAEVEELLKMSEVKYLSEMMNFPGVLYNDPEVMQKLQIAQQLGKPADGHAPGLRGEAAAKYISAGISTDHECYSLEEAVEKAGLGMKILIREGSAAKNFEELSPLIGTHPDIVMFCSDDKHPDDLAEGHMNQLVVRAIKKGFHPIDVLRCCTLNPAKHYGLDAGLLQTGDPADLILVDTLEDFTIRSVYVDGVLVAREGKTLIASVKETPFNRFDATPVSQEALVINAGSARIKVIDAYDGQLVTGRSEENPLVVNGAIASDPSRDILKLVVVNRYAPSRPSIGFVRGFGLKQGAIASCVAHDSHNIIAVGADDDSIARAINRVIEDKGGISLAAGTHEQVLPLPFAGIMSGLDGYRVSELYRQMDRQVKAMGSFLRAPYMTLSFMALLVIPELKLSDRGLFDGKAFSFTKLFVGEI
jgi:adenine deaminase